MRPNPVLADKLLKVEVLAKTANPQQLVWLAMHQDYSEQCVADEEAPDEKKAGQIAVTRLLANKRGHYGPLEHPQITFSVGNFPHSVMQQARTHRVGVSFDVQSMRYTGSRISRLIIDPDPDIESIFYIRPVGDYFDRKGKKYTYTQESRADDEVACFHAALSYARKLSMGYSEEHARGMLPFDFRQHFVVSFSLRAALHFLDLRAKADAQDEIRAMCDLMWPHIKEWAPELAEWYEANRYGKAVLSP